MKDKIKQVPIRIEESLYAKVKTVQKQEDRSFNKYVMQLIKKDLIDKGININD